MGDARFQMVMRKARTSVLVVSLVCASTLVATPAMASEADTSADPTLSSLQQRVEDTTQAYEDASKEASDIQSKIDENTARIQELESAIPGQREKSASAVRTLYKLQQDSPGLVSLLLSSEDFNEFITNFQYLDAIQERATNQVEQLKNMEDELQTTEAELDSEKSEADEKVQAAQDALNEATAARQEAQRQAEAKAAAEAAQAQAAVEAAKAAAASQATESADDASADSGSASGTVSSNVANLDTSTPTTVDTNTDRQAFVDKWTARINNYLAGSPLSGYGQTFAEAAWDNNVDPRWSPAISNTESSKGAACFLPHNAWGWGHVSWPDWDTAIRAHVAGLASGYGYTITPSAAQKYCPPTWENWYAETLAEMESI